ncbi:MAG TPA: GspMb/PilO family protein [Bryobacteraceae bacterium]
MSLSPRDRRALTLLGTAIVGYAIVYFWPSSAAAPGTSSNAVSPADSIASTENRLARLRDVAALVPQKEQALKVVSADLAKREKGIISAGTAAEARAHLLELVRRLCANESIEVRAVEVGAIGPLGDSYGAVNVAVQVECHIEQLVNLLAALAAQPELVATTDLRITAPNDSKDKLIGARIAVAGVVARKLTGDKKGGA